MKTISASLAFLLILQPVAQAQVVAGRAAVSPVVPVTGALGVTGSPLSAPSLASPSSLSPSLTPALAPVLAAPSLTPALSVIMPAAATEPYGEEVSLPHAVRKGPIAVKAMEPIKNAKPETAPLPVLRSAAATPEKPENAAGAFDGSGVPAREDAVMGNIREELRGYERTHGLKGLEGRLQRGLDPAGVLAVGSTRAKLERVASRLGASLSEVVALTNELHVGGIWKNAALLKDAASPAAKSWIIAAAVTSNGGPVKDGDLSPTEFRADLARVNSELDAALADPGAYFEAARAALVARAKTEFTLQDGVPVSAKGSGFLAMAVSGYKSGIVVDADGVRPFVGAEHLDYAALMTSRGLTRISREDRGRTANFYVDANGREIVKEVYPGLAIVLTGDMGLAREMARAAATAEETPRLNLPVKTFKLPNGLTVVVHTDKASPVVAVSITYKVGSQHETPGLSGFAHLFEHLMAQGTKSLKPREISHLIEGSGGVRNAYTMRTNTTYHSVVPKSALKTVLWAEAERMSTLNVDERALALEQAVVLEEMSLRYTNAAYAKARDAGMAETAFGKWQNQHTTIGEEADVRNARLEDVRAFYKAHYAPNNAVLALAGDVTEEEARELAARFFGPLEPRAIAPAPDLSETRMTGETRRVVSDKFAKVPLLMTAWNAPERGTKAYWALTLLGEILGAGEDSPLYRALVKDAKIALSASTNFPWWTGPNNPGGPDLFGLMTSMKPGVTADAVLALTDRVLAKLAAEGPSAEQLAAAKTTIELSWTKDLEQLIERAKTMSSYAALVGDPEALSRDFAQLMSVTAEDVRAAMNEWIVGKGRAVVEARPAPQLTVAPALKAPEAPAQKPRPEGDPRPETDPQRPAQVPNLTRFTLSNGLKVVFARDSRLPLLEARLQIPGGRTAERAGEDGLSAAVSELLLQGAEGRDARALSAAFAGLGWKLDVSRGLESISIDAAGLSRNASGFFKELANVLARATFPEDEVSLWKENKLEELKIQRSKPDFMASEKLKSELFGAAHPYGKPALTDEQVGAITREKTAEFSRRALAAGGATLVLTGDAEPEALRAQLEAAFSGWTGASATAAVPAIPEQKPARTELVDRPGSKQANLTISQAFDLKPGDPDYLAFLVMNQMLGGSATSRLFVNLRVDHGYTYGAYSRPQILEKGMLWTASAEVRNAVVAESLAEMRKEIAGMRDGLVESKTLEATKRYLAGLFLLKLSSIDYSADSLAGYERNRLSAERELATYLERLNALTPEDIQRVARKYLDPAKMVTVVVGDAASLSPALRP